MYLQSVLMCLVTGCICLLSVVDASAACLKANFLASVDQSSVSANNTKNRSRKTEVISLNGARLCLNGSVFSSDIENLRSTLNGGKTTRSEIKDGIPVEWYIEAINSGEIYTFVSGFKSIHGNQGQTRGGGEFYVKFKIIGTQCKIISAHQKLTLLTPDFIASGFNAKFIRTVYCEFE